MVGLDRLELSTSPLSGVRSSHLSYRPNFGNWWSWSGSNRRPPECKSGALPAELQPLNTGSWVRGPGFWKNQHPPPNTQHPILNRGRLDARTFQTSWKAARIHSRTPSQRCRDGLSGFPEGTPEVGVERLPVTSLV